MIASGANNKTKGIHWT